MRQSFAMPVDLSSNNTFTFNSRLWGNRPRKLAAFPVETEGSGRASWRRS